MIIKLILAGLLSVTLLSCSGQSATNHALPVHVIRFDKELFRMIDTRDTAMWPGLVDRYPEMLDIIGKGILNLRSVEVPGFRDKLLNYYSEPTLKNLYRDAIAKYDSITEIENALGHGFATLKEHLPATQVPAIYMHVSGLNQNVLVGDSLLSLSIDKYMGKDYPLYQDFFYEGQRARMRAELIAPDYLAGWLMSEYPFEGKENVLLDRMIYEGKIKYIAARALDIQDYASLLGYTPKAMDWCEKHEGALWRGIIERKHLFTPDLPTTNRYFEDTPTGLLAEGAPGNVATWLGWRIIEKYMKETGSTWEALMRNNDAQAILVASKYKPHNEF